jgi:agmatine deiminase
VLARFRRRLVAAALALLTVLPAGVAGAAPERWSALENATRGNLAAMLAALEREPVPPHYRTNRSAAELVAVLERSGRFAQLGLSAAEGHILVEAVYRRLNLPLVRRTPPAPVAVESASLPFGGNYRVGAEFEPLAGVLLRWPFDWSALRDEYAGIVRAIGEGGARARIWVDTPAQQTQAKLYLQLRGVSTAHIDWVVENTDSVWLRDYGPQFIYDRASTAWGVADFHYYDSRPNDDDTPIVVATAGSAPRVNRQTAEVVYTEGGNLNVDGRGFVSYSERTYSRNPGVATATIDGRITSALQTNRALVLQDPALDATGHVDMFTKIVDVDRVLVGRYDPDEFDYAVLEDAASAFQGALNGEGRPWNVVRIRQPDVYYAYFVLPVVRTYTNSLIVNNRVIVPTYNIPDDAGALEIYRTLFPGKTIVPIDSRDIIEAAGSWHCVTMEFADPNTPDGP